MLIKADMFAAGGGGKYLEKTITSTTMEYYPCSKGAFYWEGGNGNGGFSIDENGTFHGAYGTASWYLNVTYTNGQLGIALGQNQYNVALYGCYFE